MIRRTHSSWYRIKRVYMKQEYRIIPVEYDQIRHIARKMRRNGVILAMIHGYLDQNGEPVVSYEYQL